MRYFPHTEKDIKKMFSSIGVSSIDELFNSIPENLRIKKNWFSKKPLSEQELLDYFKSIENQNKFLGLKLFLGAGSYFHFIPETVNYLSMRGEFLTPYTPYQPEVSQGTLEVLFEYQTMICGLTGMDVSNASLYDGASASAEGILLAWRVTKKNKFLISKALHPEYIQTIRTYISNLPIEIELIEISDDGTLSKEDFEKKYSEDIGGVLIQSPNFFGVIEDYGWVKEKIGDNSLLIVAVSEALSLGALKPPSHYGADVVVGEAQSFGLPPYFGGPYLGFIATKKKFLWELPGRIVGETIDEEGNRGFVLTLSTREQHIRRERATSNICSNESWCAIRATIFLSLLGKNGIKKVAIENMKLTNYAQKKFREKGFEILFYNSPKFNEFAVKINSQDKAIEKLIKNGILPGLKLEKFFNEYKDYMLFTFTEIIKPEDIDELVNNLEEFK